MKRLIVLLSIISLSLQGLSQERVDIRFRVFLDNQSIESDSIYVGITPSKNDPKLVRITNDFNTWLYTDIVYNVVIKHPRYQKQVFKIDTSESYNRVIINVYLSSNEPDCYGGYMKYDKKLGIYTSL